MRRFLISTTALSVALTQVAPAPLMAQTLTEDGSVIAEDGRDQVTGFQMAGEVIGLDGIVNDRHACDAVALEDAEVCVMPFNRIGELSREINAALRLPAMREKMISSGDPYPAEPSELSARLLRDIDAYGTVIQATVK